MADSLVRVIVGKLGAGKSWYVVGKMLDALAMGEVVVSNLQLDWPAVEQFLGKRKVSRENYRYVSSKAIDERPGVLLDHLTEGSCLVIDEVHLFLNARMFRDNAAKGKDFMEFLTQARKMSVDCYLVSQDERNVDAQLVRMATHIVRLINWLHLPVLGTIAPLPLTIARICAPDGVTAIGREWIWRTGGLGKCYQTRQKFSDVELKGKPAKQVIGARARKKDAGYGPVLVIAGVLGLALDFYLRNKAAEAERQEAELAALSAAKEEERKAVKAARQALRDSEKTVPVPEDSPSRKMGQLQQPEKEGPVTKAERAAIEAALPSVWRLTNVYFVLVGGQRLRHGDWFLSGQVTGWRLQGGTVLVKIDSVETPEIRLHYANSARPFLYDHRGGIVRRAHRGGSGTSAAGGPQSLPLAQSGDGYGQGLNPAAPVASSTWVQQPPVIPPGGPLIDWYGGRVDFPAPPQRRPAAPPNGPIYRGSGDLTGWPR